MQCVAATSAAGSAAKLAVQADAILAALAASEVNRPVKIALTRQQMFHVTIHRPATMQRVRLAAERDGRLTVNRPPLLVGQHAGREFLRNGRQRHAKPLRRAQPADGHRLATLDLPVASAMRAPGEAVGMLALECAMDELAERARASIRSSCAIRNEPTQDPGDRQVPSRPGSWSTAC